MNLEKAEEPEIKLPTSAGSLKKQENSRKKNIYFCFIDYDKAFDCVDHNKLWKILQEREYQTILPASGEICMQVNSLNWTTVRTGHGTTDWFRIGQEVYQGCILSPCLFNFYVEYIIRLLG